MTRPDLLRHDPLLLVFVLTFVLAGARPALGQCALQWQPGDPIPTVHGHARANLVWDADGAGPAPAVLVVGGRFGAGAMLTTGLSAFDGATWVPLGAPPIPDVTALTTWNGLLVAAGGIGNQGTIATWNGAAWSVLGNTNGRVNTVAVFNGNLFVGGFFTTVNGGQARNIAQWNGTSWSEPGLGVTGEVMTMAVFGSLHVGGHLTQAGALPIGHLAIWNGSAWAAGAAFNARVRSLAARLGPTAASSFLFAGGDFTAVAGVQAGHIARFTLSTNAWTAIPGLPGLTCRTVHVRSTGSTTFQLHAAVQNNNSDRVWRLSGTTWLSLGPLDDESEPLPTSLAFFNGQYVVACEANPVAPGALANAVRSHDGTSWQPVTGLGFDDRIRTVTSLGNDIVIGGDFRRYGGTTLERIARGSPGAWQPLGAGILGGTGVHALCTLPNGDLVAGGDFTTAGGIAAANIARWDGSNWFPLGPGVIGRVSALLALPNGDLIAGGAFVVPSSVPIDNIARWNGAIWLPLGTGVNARVNALCRRSNGDIFATGPFSMAGGSPASRIARWDGTNWSALGVGLDDAGLALAVLPDDDVVVGGFFTTAGSVFATSIARWNGSTWFAQSTSTAAWDFEVTSLVALPDGDYFAGGVTSFFGLGGGFGGSDSNLARHTGGTSSLSWEAADLLGQEVTAATQMPNGDVVVGGIFDGAGGLASHNVAVLRPTCPAAAVAFGSGCVGSGGANVLVATALPWIGSTFRGRATGMPAAAVALAVTGFQPLALPMPGVLPQGVAGCTLLASPDLLDATLPAGGVAVTQLGLPKTTSLAGQLLHHQVVPLELDLAGNLVAVTGTNGLTLTIGVL